MQRAVRIWLKMSRNKPKAILFVRIWTETAWGSRGWWYRVCAAWRRADCCWKYLCSSFPSKFWTTEMQRMHQRRLVWGTYLHSQARWCKYFFTVLITLCYYTSNHEHPDFKCLSSVFRASKDYFSPGSSPFPPSSRIKIRQMKSVEVWNNAVASSCSRQPVQTLLQMLSDERVLLLLAHLIKIWVFAAVKKIFVVSSANITVFVFRVIEPQHGSVVTAL